jgi:heme exporter protein D
LSDFFAMGGYGAYVWPAFGFAVAVLLGLLWQSWRAARSRDVELEQLRRLVRPGPTGRPRLRPVPARAAELRADASAPSVSRDASA